MSFQFSCPECHAVLKTANPMPAGKMIRCPKCNVFFAMPVHKGAAAETDEENAPARSARGPAPDEGALRPRTKSRPAPVDDEDDLEDDDNDEDARPRRKKKFAKKKKKAGGSGLGLALAGGALVLVLVLVGGTLGFVEIPGMDWTGFLRSYANKGTGDEELLAYAPADSNLTGALDLVELRKLLPNLDTLLSGQQAGQMNGPDPMADLKEMVGIEPAQIDKMVFAGKFSDPGSNPFIQAASGPPMSLALRSSVPFDQRQMYRFFKKKAADTVSETRHRYQGKIYYKYPNDGAHSGPYVFAPSNRTLVFITPSVPVDEVQKIVASDGSTISLTGSGWDVVSKASGHSFWVVLPIQGSIRENLLKSLRNAANLPPNLQPLVPALQKVDSVGVWLGSANDRYVLTAGLLCSDEKAAGSLSSAGKKAFDDAFGGFAGQLKLQGMLLLVPPSAKTLIKDLIDHLRFKANGTMAMVTVSAKQSDVRKLIQDLQTSAAQRIPGGGMPPGGRQPFGGGRPGGGFPGAMPPRPARPGSRP